MNKRAVIVISIAVLIGIAGYGAVFRFIFGDWRYEYSSYVKYTPVIWEAEQGFTKAPEINTEEHRENVKALLDWYGYSWKVVQGEIFIKRLYIIASEADWIFYNLMVSANDTGSIGYIEKMKPHTQGRIVCQPPKYYQADEFPQYGLKRIRDLKNGDNYLDQNGKLILKVFPFDTDYDRFSEGLARFTANGKMGFFDEQGQVVIEPRYEFVTPFENGYAAVAQDVTYHKDGERTMVDGRWGFINTEGEQIIPCMYDDICLPFNGKGMTVVKKAKKYLLVDTRGVTIKEL